MSGTKFPEINNNSSNLGASSGSQGDSMDVSRQLSILKHRKKTAANDAQLLLNRIALLQKEEERARRKIEKTKDRASEILTMRDENFQRVDRFVRAAEEEHYLQATLHEKNMKADEIARKNRLKQIHKMLNKKQSAVMSMRESKKTHEKMLLQTLEKDLQAKQRKRNEVKAAEEESRQRKLAQKQEAERIKHEKYLAMAQAEEEEARKAEEFVKDLERKEQEWLSKLTKTQKVQENAYGYLENALLKDHHGIGTIGGPTPASSASALGHGAGAGAGGGDQRQSVAARQCAADFDGPASLRQREQAARGQCAVLPPHSAAGAGAGAGAGDALWREGIHSPGGTCRAVCCGVDQPGHATARTCSSARVQPRPRPHRRQRQ